MIKITLKSHFCTFDKTFDFLFYRFMQSVMSDSVKIFVFVFIRNSNVGTVWNKVNHLKSKKYAQLYIIVSM